jgi:O-antigen ligase
MQRLATPEGIYGFRKTPQSRPFGPFVNQHHFAAFMEMTAGSTFGLMFGKTIGRDKKLLLLMALTVMGIATVWTSSRGGVIGFASMLSFVVLVNLFSRERSGKAADADAGGSIQRNIALAVGGIAVVILVFGTVLYLGGGDALFRGIGISNASGDLTSGRTHYWAIAIKVFLEHPILGTGYDSFGAAYTKFDTWNGTLRVDQAHNEYLQTLADSGLVGFACIAAFIYLLFKKGLGTISAVGSSFRRNAAVGALAGCFGILIHSFFDFPLRTPSNAFFFLLLAAIATVAIKTSDDVEHARRRHRST